MTDGRIAEVTTIFLTGRECPWRCLMCDLWKHTTVERTPVGAIPAQIDFALTELGRSRREEALISAPSKPADERAPSGQPSPNADPDGPFPLTPALSLGEREQARQRINNPNRFASSSVAGGVPPRLGERAGVGSGAHEESTGQIPSTLSVRPPRHLKLYNSGSFFDRAAVPVGDYKPIARRAACFERVIVESHPALIGDLTLRFRDLLIQNKTRQRPNPKPETPNLEPASASSRWPLPSGSEPQLEVAMGLETAHPEVLEKLNKRITLEQFAQAAAFLKREGIALRVFVLIKPPFMDEAEGLAWAVRSAAFAFDCGATVVSLIPTRPGNGALEALAVQGQFAPPRLATVEAALEQGLALGRGRVFVDLWDLEQFSDCPACFQSRRERLQRLNLEQQWLPSIRCERCS